MSAIDELNIQTTIVCMRKAAMLSGRVSKRLELVAHDEQMFRETERNLAIEYLHRKERDKQKRDTLHIE